MEKKLGNKRCFLNPKEGIAAINFEVTVTDNLKGGSYPNLDVEATITLSDCSRQITLEFDTWCGENNRATRKVIKDRRAKLARLKKLLDEFIDCTDKAYDYIEERLGARKLALEAYNRKKK